MVSLLKVKLESLNKEKNVFLEGLCEFPQSGENFILYTKLEADGFDYLKTTRVNTVLALSPDQYMFTTDNTNYSLTILKD